MANRDKNEGAELQAAWSKGRPAEIKRERPTSSVLSIRLPTEFFETLSERAKAEGKPASLLARELLERGLAIDGPMTPVDLARTFTKWVEEVARPVQLSISFTPSKLVQDSWISSYVSLSESAFGAALHLLRTRVHSLVIAESKTAPAAEKVA